MPVLEEPLTVPKLDLLRSPWRTMPLAIDGTLAPAEWKEAAQMPLPKGYLFAQNDAENLYLAFDLTADTGNDPNNDFFWLMIDVDRNGVPTPYHDILYGTPPNEPNRLGKWLMVGPGACVPTADTFHIASRVRQGFGPSLHSRMSHRIWELAINLKEIGVDLHPFGPPPIVRFGLHIASSNPPFAADTPERAFYDFHQFHSIVLSTHFEAYQTNQIGKVMGGVGFIPASKIGTNGLATNDYAGLNVVNAAFGGTLNILENATTIHTLRQQGAAAFTIRHRYGFDSAALNAAPWLPLRTTWTNYRWNGRTYVVESFGPDGDNRYKLIDPTADYSIKSLLFVWNTAEAPNVLHQFELDFFNAHGKKIDAPHQTLTLRIDNRAPRVELLDVKHGNVSVKACDIVDLTSATDSVSIEFLAYDGEGLLESYDLTARWGDNKSAHIAGDNYAAHGGSPQWFGETSKSVSYTPPNTCAYQFLVGAKGRVTNGYYQTQYAEAYRNVTLRVPGSPLFKAAVLTHLLPHGFKA